MLSILAIIELNRSLDDLAGVATLPLLMTFVAGGTTFCGVGTLGFLGSFGEGSDDGQVGGGGGDCFVGVAGAAVGGNGGSGGIGGSGGGGWATSSGAGGNGSSVSVLISSPSAEMVVSIATTSSLQFITDS